jgi:NifU-like protein involved in Fe-S cluster formation
VGVGENQACGDQVRLALASDAQGRLEARFTARGCSASLALAAYVCAELDGRSLDDAAAFDLRAEVEHMGGLAPTQQHALELVTRALSGALAEARRRCHPEGVRPQGDGREGPSCSAS